MESIGKIASDAGYQIDTVDAEAFELCLDIYGEGRLLATLIYDGKPMNAFTDSTVEDDGPVGWCVQFSDELRESEPVLWCLRCDPDRLDLATAAACGMVQLRLLQTGWWHPLPDNRLWEEGNSCRVKPHQRVEP